ncbi:hypothetical protein F4821DRAFT_243429 [Hypoxylon rubiginosum]|uniref:Uncharacterized protein n=1 Tax=Hypoxylon rubiginosum TaxID=110542 RepID=A0ACC0CUU6_9PEZI|nr:hypothetical protein F4821DRAFT_243429 [Hypoxylon rubiginosum]
MARNKNNRKNHSRPGHHQHRSNRHNSQHHYTHHYEHQLRTNHHHGQDYYRVYQVEPFDIISQDSHECNFPRFPSRTTYKPFRIIIILVSWLTLAGALASQVMLLVFTIKFINTDNTGFESDHPNFHLFKNSGFEECSSLVPDAATCTAILDIIRHLPGSSLAPQYLDRGYTPITTDWRSHDGTHYSWCTSVSCFNGFKVVPSSYRQTIIGLTNFDVLNTLNMMGIVCMWRFVKRNWDLYKKQDRCTASLKELNVVDWIALVYSIGGPILWWWVSFILFAAEPVPNSTVSINAWVSTWLLASNIHYHPYSCILHTRGHLKQVLSWLLRILTVAQWSATVYVLNVGWKLMFGFGEAGVSQGYDCLESMFPDAPGMTHCSTETLCSDSTLLANLPFVWDDMESLITNFGVACFVFFSLAAMQPFIFASWRSIRRVMGLSSSQYTWMELFMRCDMGPTVGPAIIAIGLITYTTMSSSLISTLSSIIDRQAPVVADMNCNAVHVGLSTWRYYLDLNDNVPAKTLRIATSWFNG